MNGKDLIVPSARECVAEAYRALSMGGDVARADVWLRMARELREDAQFRKMWVPPTPRPAEASDERRTLHDVLGIVCTHGLVALQWKDVAMGDVWWVHVDGTSCDNPDQSGDMFRRRSQAMREAHEVVEERKAADAGEPTMRLEQRMEDDPDRTLVRPYVEETKWDRAAETNALDTAVMPMPERPQPEEGEQAECRNHDEYSRLVYRDGAWLHTTNGSPLCPVPRMVDGEERWDSFANPLR